MVSALRPFRSTARDTTRKLIGRFYAAVAQRPVSKPVHTQTNVAGCAPRLDLLLSDNKLQPFIHDAIVTVVYRKKTTRFHVFVKNHVRLRQNGIIQRWTGAGWKGDIVVMRKGVIEDFVSLRGGDHRLADFAVKKFVERVEQKTRFRIPKGMVFEKA